MPPLDCSHPPEQSSHHPHYEKEGTHKDTPPTDAIGVKINSTL